MHRTASVWHLIPICRLPKTLHDLGLAISLTSSLFTVPLYGDLLAVCHWHASWHTAASGLLPLLSLCLETLIIGWAYLQSPHLGSSHLSPTTAWQLLCLLLASVFCFAVGTYPTTSFTRYFFFYLICIFESFPIASSCSQGIPRAVPYTPKIHGAE